MRRLVPASSFPVFFFLIISLSPVSAERLPITTYTTSDGLGSELVGCMVRDSRGFMWFGTRAGLSRFDGQEFVTYSTGEGLPDPTVNDLIETRAGEYWIATNGGGVCRFDPRAATTSRRNDNAFVRDRPFCTTIRITETGCSQKICVAMGAKRAPGEILACVPNALIVELEGGGFDPDAPDAVSR